MDEGSESGRQGGEVMGVKGRVMKLAKNKRVLKGIKGQNEDNRRSAEKKKFVSSC